MSKENFQPISAALMRKSNGKIYLFKGDQYIQISSVGSIDSGYPKFIQEGWPGLNSDFQAGIDAALWRDSNSKIYLFKGNQCVRYSNVSKGVDKGYPKPISDDFTELNAEFKSGIDAALMRSSTKQIYLFKGKNVVRYSDLSKGPDGGYPKTIAEEFEGNMNYNFCVGGLDAALWRNSNSSVYFFLGEDYTKVSEWKYGQDYKYPQNISEEWY